MFPSNSSLHQRAGDQHASSPRDINEPFIRNTEHAANNTIVARSLMSDNSEGQSNLNDTPGNGSFLSSENNVAGTNSGSALANIGPSRQGNSEHQPNYSDRVTEGDAEILLSMLDPLGVQVRDRTNFQVLSAVCETIDVRSRDRTHSLAGSDAQQGLGIEPKYPAYILLVSRKVSFQNWQGDPLIKLEMLAVAGFFYSGTHGLCICFFCGGSIKEWVESQDPFVRHALLFPDCAYIIQRRGLNFIETVRNLSDSNVHITHDVVQAVMASKGLSAQTESASSNMGNDAAVRSLIDEGYDREVVCTYALELRNRGEHLSASSLLERLREAGHSAQRDSVQVPRNRERGCAGSNHEIQRLQEVQQRTLALRRQSTCKICDDGEVQKVFLPCGHFVACQECAAVLHKCPLEGCQQPINALILASLQ